MTPSVAVLGAGDAGRALAATIAEAGLEVTLWSRTAARLSAELVLYRAGHAVAVRVYATTDLGEALARGSLILVATNSTAHGEIATACAPHLGPDHVVVLVPGHVGGALEARSAIGLGPAVIAETCSLPFVARGAGEVIAVLQEKESIALAALPAAGTGRAAELLSMALPRLRIRAAESVLETSFGTMTAVMQAPLLVFNAARVEAPGTFRIYREGLSPSVSAVMERLDDERRAVARAYGAPAERASDWLARVYGARGEGLHARLLSTPGYADVLAPATLEHRFLVEHVPMGLVPIAALGALAGVPTPLADAIVTLASALSGRDLRAGGRTLARLGVEGKRAADVRALCRGWS